MGIILLINLKWRRLIIKSACVILGAGASAYYGVPMLKNFFAKVLEKSKLVRDREFLSQLNELNLFCKSVWRIDLNRNPKKLDVEEVFSLLTMATESGHSFFSLDSDIKFDHDKLDQLKLFLEDLIYTVIEECSINNNSEKVYGKMINVFLKDYNQITLINFNYDSICDNEIITYFKSQGFGYAMPDYGVKFAGIFNKSGDDIADNFQVSDKILHLKMHGSLNIKHCYKCASSYLYLFNGLYNKKSGFANNCKIDGGRLNFALIPPVWKLRKGHKFLDKIWEKAFKQMTLAKSVYFIGYSFPKEDFYFRYLLLRSINMNKSKPKIFVVDPAESEPERIAEIFSANDDRIELVPSTFKDFINK